MNTRPEAEPGGPWRQFLLLLVAVPVVFNAIALLPELTASAPSRNDNAAHYLYIQDASAVLARGGNPLDFWVPELDLGFPSFLYYQHLPHLFVVGLHRVLPGSLDLLTTFNLVRYVLLAGFPLTVFWSLRRMGHSLAAAAVSAGAASLLSANHRFGLEYESYVWLGWGLYTQLWAMHLSFIALACVDRVLERGAGYLAAILALTALALSHLIYAYLMAITLALVVVVGARRETLLPRMLRLAIVAAVAGVACSYMLLPFLAGSQYLNAAPVARRYDMGAETILQWLASGDFFDHGRLPVLTFLLVVGVVAALVHRSRLTVLALAGFIVWLVLYLAPVLGPTTDFSSRLLFYRFIGSLQMFAIILMGLGGAWIWRGLARPLAGGSMARRLRVFQPVAAVAALLALLTPAMAERLAYYQQNGLAMMQTRTALDSNTSLREILATLKKQPPGGRVYAGLSRNGGRDIAVGLVTLSDVLTFHAIAAMSTYQAWSLNADIEFGYRDRSHYDLFDVRYVIAPADLAPPRLYEPLQRTTRYVLYRVRTSGAAMYGAIMDRRPVSSQRALAEGNLGWLRGPAPGQRRFIRWDYLSPGRPFTPSPGCPEGRTLDERVGSDALHLVVDCAAASALILKMTYHPNWRVTVDGEPAETYMVSPSFIAVDLPPGRHDIEAVYVATPAKLPLLAIGVLALIGAAVFRDRLDGLPRRLIRSPVSGAGDRHS